MSTHLTIKNENHPNPRTTTPEKKEPRRPFSLFQLVAGDMICFVVKSENLMKRGLWSRLTQGQIQVSCIFIQLHENYHPEKVCMNHSIAIAVL